MNAAVEHYDRLLAEHYTWMLGGDLAATIKSQVELLSGLGIASPGDAAVDLGCGPGQQTMALARLGFASVTAVDTSAALLDELAECAERSDMAANVRPVQSDIRGALPELATPGSIAAVVCMGDTLPHLPSHSDVEELIADVVTALSDGGSFVVTYRDLTQELLGEDRFIPVRSTADQILTCFLDYVDENTVLVHDVVHTRDGDAWQMRVGSYPKLRIAPTWLSERCQAAGLQVRHDDLGPRGLRVLHAVKEPAP